MARMFARRPAGPELTVYGESGDALFLPTVHGYDRDARVKPGDVETFEILLDEDNKVRPSYTLPGVGGVRFAVAGGAYGSDGADLYVGDVTSSPTLVTAMISAGSTGVVLLDLTSGQSGIVDDDSDVVSVPYGTDAGVGSISGDAPTSPVITAVAPGGVDSGVGTISGTTPTAVNPAASVSGALYPHSNGSLNTTAHNVTDSSYAPGTGTAGEAVRFRWGLASWQTLISQYGESEALKAKSVGVPPSGASSFSVQVGSGAIVTATLTSGVFDTSKSGMLHFFYESYDFYDEETEQQVTGTNVVFCEEGVISNGRLVLA